MVRYRHRTKKIRVLTQLVETPTPSFALFAKGFRCFFLGATLLAAATVGIWFLVYSGKYPAGFHYYPAPIWHQHEMVFGYAGAVIAGFLLTAVSNWTGRETLRGLPLAGLFLIWLAAHGLPFAGGVSGWLIATLNIFFFIALAVAIAVPLVAAANYRNLFMVVIITIFAVCNAIVHAQLLGITDTGANKVIEITLYLQLLLIVIIAGRVFPMFSAGGVAVPYEPIRMPWLETAAISSFMFFALVMLVPSPKELKLFATLLAALVHLLRVAGWHNPQIYAVPLVWVLHVGYYFLVAGILLTGISSYFHETRVPGLHAMLIGCLGLITVGMMARVSLGHSGRNIHRPPRILILIFAGIAGAAFVRSVLPIIGLEYYLAAIRISAVLWVSSFTVFAVVYLRTWVAPRIDGKPG